MMLRAAALRRRSAVAAKRNVTEQETTSGIGSRTEGALVCESPGRVSEP